MCILLHDTRPGTKSKHHAHAILWFCPQKYFSSTFVFSLTYFGAARAESWKYKWACFLLKLFLQVRSRSLALALAILFSLGCVCAEWVYMLPRRYLFSQNIQQAAWPTRLRIQLRTYADHALQITLTQPLCSQDLLQRKTEKFVWNVWKSELFLKLPKSKFSLKIG